MTFIAEKTDPDSSVTEYLMAVNSRVFFWAGAERLNRLRQAREYRTEDQVVLHVDTRPSSSDTARESNSAGSTPER